MADPTASKSQKELRLVQKWRIMAILMRTDYKQFDEWIGSFLLGSYAVPNPWLLASSALAAARSSMPLEVRKNLER